MTGSKLSVWWKCSVCGGKYKARVSNRAILHRGCPYCAGKQVLKGYNDLKTIRPDIALDAESAKQFSISTKPVMLNVDKLEQIKEGGKVPGIKVTLSTAGLTRTGWELKQKSIRKIVGFKSKKFPKATPEVLIVGYWKD